MRFLIVALTIVVGLQAASLGRDATNKTPVAPSSLRAFGAACDGHSDDTDAIRAWLAALEPGQRGDMPAGVCVFREPLKIVTQRLSLQGAGPYQSVFLYAGDAATSDLITIGDGREEIRNWYLRDIRISSRTKLTARSALRLRKLVRSTLQDVVIDGQDGSRLLWDGIWFDEVDQVTYRGFDIRVQNVGLSVSGAPDHGPRANLMLSQGKIMDGTIGIRVGGGFGGLSVDQVDIIRNDRNVVVDNELAHAANRELMFGSLVTLDSATKGPAITLADRLAGSNSWIQLSGTWLASGATDGIYVEPGVKWTVSVQGGTIFNFKRDGIRNESELTRLFVNGTVIRNNEGFGVNSVVKPVIRALNGPMLLLNRKGNLSAPPM